MSIPKFAAPLQWNSAHTYTKGEVVYTGWNAYTALQNVPANTPITNSNYWVLTGNLRERVYSGSGGSGGTFTTLEIHVESDESNPNNPPKLVITNGKALKDALDAFINSGNVTYERCYISLDASGHTSRIYDTLNYCYGQSGENDFNCFIQANFIDSSEVMKIKFDSSLQSNPYSIYILGFDVMFDSSNVVGNDIIVEIGMS